MENVTINFDLLLHEIEEVLPNQGPLKVFIHHNTLHSFENKEFYNAIEEASGVYHAHPYLSESEYHDLIKSNRISEAVIKVNLNDELEKLNVPHELAYEALINGNYIEFDGEIPWLIKESVKTLKNETFEVDFEKDYCPTSELLLWLDQTATNFESKDWLQKSILSKNKNLSLLSKIFCFYLKNSSITLKEYNLLLSKPGSDYQQKIFKINHEDHFLKLCANFLDNQFSVSPLSDKTKGFFKYGLDHLLESGINVNSEILNLTENIEKFEKGEFYKKLLSICYKDTPKINNDTFVKEILFRSALSFPGWAGAYSQRGQFFDYLCLLLIFKSIYGFVFRKDHKQKTNIVTIASRLFLIFCNNQLKKISEIENIIKILYYFENNSRLRIFHKSYEDTIHTSFIDVLESKSLSDKGKSYEYNLVFCLDEREESIRRYVEAESEKVSTFGYAGFFGIDATLEGQDGSKVAICPPLVTPSRIILSKIKNFKKELFYFDINLIFDNLRLNPISTTILSLTSPIGIILQKLRDYKKINKIQELSANEYEFDYLNSKSNPNGFTFSEIAQRVANLLKITGLINNPGKYVVLIGHGALSSNNPYKSAYDCGACGGRPGDVNARIFAQMANHPIVRDELKKINCQIPDSLIFIGGYHNTTTDEIILFDDDILTKDNFNHTNSITEIKTILKKASIKNAKERSRRFSNLSNTQNIDILEEVKKRAYYLAEPRPEYGHATNAFCVVGGRELTKDLFLDRRAFLVSYEREIDESGEILAAILKAIIPVCMGINLEYFFSAIDNYAYGAGSKLPQNIVAGIATMTGSLGDIRTGLPKQMVEIHEPIRLAMIIDTDKETIEKIFSIVPSIKDPIINGWLRLFLVNKQENKVVITSYRKEDFHCTEIHSTEIKKEILDHNDKTTSGQSKLEEILKSEKHLPFSHVN